MKHIGTFRGTRLILLGYNKGDDTIAVLNAAVLSEGEREWLSDIVESDYAQKYNYLYRALIREYHHSGTNGWLWAISKMTQRLPAYEVNVLDTDQSIEWRGSGGTSALDRNAAREAIDAGLGDQIPQQRMNRKQTAAQVQATQAAAVGQNDAILEALKGLTSTMAQVNARLTSVENSQKTDERVKREEKRRTDAKKAAAKTAATKAAATAAKNAQTNQQTGNQPAPQKEAESAILYASPTDGA